MGARVDGPNPSGALPRVQLDLARRRSHAKSSREDNNAKGTHCTCRSLPRSWRLRAHAQQTIKIGLINVFRPVRRSGAQMDNGVKLYMKQQGDTVAGKKIEIIRKDTGGAAPDVAKRLAQELIVRDGVDILAGFLLTPNALAAADVSAEAKKFMVVMNAATSIIITKSPYMVRTSVTLPQVIARRSAPGRHQERHQEVPTPWCPTTARATTPRRRSRSAFKEAGGEIVGSVRFPVANPDFSAFVQRAKDSNPECDLHLHARRRAAGGARQGVRRARHRPDQDQGAGLGRAHRGRGAQEHGRRRPRHHHRLALRLQAHEPRNVDVREGLQRNARAQPGHLLDRRL